MKNNMTFKVLFNSMLKESNLYRETKEFIIEYEINIENYFNALSAWETLFKFMKQIHKINKKEYKKIKHIIENEYRIIDRINKKTMTTKIVY